MDVLEITLFGHFAISYRGQAVKTIKTPRQQAMLAYLLIHRGAPIDRGVLAANFWPETSDKQARSNLRTLLARIRRQLPDADRFIEINRSTITWRQQALIRFDVAEFESSLRKANGAQSDTERETLLEQAVSLYTGALLPHLYDEWLQPHRLRLQDDYLNACQVLIALHEGRRNYGAAIDYVQRLLDTDPLREKAHLDRMRLYALTGSPNRALQCYAETAELMAAQLGVEPGPELQSTADRLRQRIAVDGPAFTATSEPPPSALASSFVGREQEWQHLTQVWSQRTDGSTQLTLLIGEAGIGKTHLLRNFRDWVERQGHSVIRLRCHPSLAETAYAPLVDWLRTAGVENWMANLDDIWLIELSRLLPELRIIAPNLPEPLPLAAAWQRQRLHTALVQTLVSISSELTVTVDDLQWCDDETLNWLHTLLVSPTGLIEAPQTMTRLMFVGALRAGERVTSQTLPTLLALLRQDGLLFEFHLSRLSTDETHQLITSMTDPIADSGMSMIVTMAEGNPLFVIESVRAVKQGALPVITRHLAPDLDLPTEAEPSLLQLFPRRIMVLLQARLGQLSVTAQRVVGQAGLIGRAFSLDVMRAVAANQTNLDEGSLVDALDELIRREIIHEEQPAVYEFSHGLLRETAIADLSTASRQLYHRYVGEALAQVHHADLDTLAVQIAGHYERAGMADQAAAFYYRGALAAEAIYAHESAIRNLEQALELIEDLPAQLPTQAPRIQYLERLGDILDFVGRHEQARAVFGDALAAVTPFEAIEHSQLLRKIGKTHEGQRNFERALATYNEAEETLLERSTRSIPAWWHAWIQVQLERLWIFYWTNEWQKSAKLAESIRPSIEQYGNPAQQINFYLVRGSTLCLEHRYRIPDDALNLTRLALQLAEETDDLGQIAWTRFVFGFCLLWTRDFDQSETQILSALDVAEARGDLVHQARCTTYLAIIGRFRGDLEMTQHYARSALETAQTVQMVEYEATASANLGWVAWRRQIIASATDQLELALLLWQQLPTGHPSASVRWAACFPLMSIAMAENRIDDAVACARELVDIHCQHLPDPIDGLLTSAIEAHSNSETEFAHKQLDEIIKQAQILGYL